MNPPVPQRLDVAERALEKERSRAADARALASGQVGVGELRSQNEAFVGDRGSARIDLAAARALA